MRLHKYKLFRKFKCLYYRIKNYFGAKKCAKYGCLETTGFATNENSFMLIRICKRCGKIVECIKTPMR
jgi:hypothetical protein